MKAFLLFSAFVLDFLSLRRLSLVYFILSPFFITQGKAIPIEVVYGIGYFFSTPLMLLGLCGAIPKMFEPFTPKQTTIFAICFYCLVIISVVVNVPEFLSSSYCFYVLYFKLFSSIACFFVLTHALDEKDLSALYSLLVILALIGFAFMPFLFIHDLQSFGNPLEWRYAFFFDDGNAFACFLAVVAGMTFPALVAKYISGQKLKKIVVINVFLVIEIFATGSRGGMLLVLITFAASVFPTRDRRLIRASLGALALLIFMAAVVFFIRYAFTRAEFSDIARILTYQFAWDIIKDRPFFGIGFGNFMEAFQYSYPSYLVLLMRSFMVIHNGPLGLAVEIGIPGTLCWLALLGIPAQALFRRIKSNSLHFYPAVEIAALNVLIVFFVSQLYLPYCILQDFFWAFLAFPFIVERNQILSKQFRYDFGFSRNPSHSGMGDQTGFGTAESAAISS